VTGRGEPRTCRARWLAIGQAAAPDGLLNLGEFLDERLAMHLRVNHDMLHVVNVRRIPDVPTEPSQHIRSTDRPSHRSEGSAVKDCRSELAGKLEENGG
jgi:hypothetical protein